MKKNKRISLLLLSVFMLTIVSCAGIQVNTAVADTGLNDVQNHWAAAAITEMVDAGVVSGFPDGTFRPDNNVSRAEFAVLVVKTFKFDMTGGKVFTDTRNHWAKDYVAAANANGVVKGYSDTKFGPDDPITREQMAVMVVAAANLESTSTATSFNDSSNISSWAKEAVAIASEQKIITGFPDGSFQPQATATRAQAVTVLKKAYPDLAPVVDLSKFDKAGTYGPATGTQTIKGDVTISVAGVELQNVTITGDLLISEAVGDGDVTLNNVTVKGVTTIKGGGADSVYFTDSTFEKVIINKAKGVVRLVLENSKIAELEDNSCVNVVGDGEITKALFNANDFKSEIIPVKYTIASGKSGIIAGETVKGRTPSGGGDPGTPTLTVTAKPAPGDITAGSKVELIASDADADIYYTVDGTTPTESSTEYTGPITVNAEMTIKAIAVKEGYKTSAVASFEYELELLANLNATDNGIATTLTGTVASAVTKIEVIKDSAIIATYTSGFSPFSKTLIGAPDGTALKIKAYTATADKSYAVTVSSGSVQPVELLTDLNAIDNGIATTLTGTVASAVTKIEVIKDSAIIATYTSGFSPFSKTLIGAPGGTALNIKAYTATADKSYAVIVNSGSAQPVELLTDLRAIDNGIATTLAGTVASAVTKIEVIKDNAVIATYTSGFSPFSKTLIGAPVGTALNIKAYTATADKSYAVTVSSSSVGPVELLTDLVAKFDGFMMTSIQASIDSSVTKIVVYKDGIVLDTFTDLQKEMNVLTAPIGTVLTVKVFSSTTEKTYTVTVS